jgi:hypothetical protein
MYAKLSNIKSQFFFKQIKYSLKINSYSERKYQLLLLSNLFIQLGLASTLINMAFLVFKQNYSIYYLMACVA